MNNPEFLLYEEILLIHDDQIRHSGGSAEIRDAGLLESALAQPQTQFGGQYLHNDIFEMAAAYLFHIIQNHPFVDGNKRTGAASADIFLTMNGFNLHCKEKDFEKLVFSTASGKKSKKEIAEFLRQSSKRK